MIELASFFAAAAIGIGVMALLEFGIIKPYLRWKCAKSKTPETKNKHCPDILMTVGEDVEQLQRLIEETGAEEDE